MTPLHFFTGSILVLSLSACTAAPTPAESADELVDRGRLLLDEHRPAEAQPLFEEAARREGGTLRTRMWVLRAWMDQGRNNDTLDALDELDRSGASEPEMSYLYGMAFARRAEGHLADGVRDSSIQMNFLDAVDRLKQAVESDGTRFRDAFLPLARSAWYTEDLELARWAAERATLAYPEDPEAWLMRGRIGMSALTVEHGANGWSPLAEEHWSDATRSFQSAIELLGQPADPGEAASLSAACLELGHAYLWKEKRTEAARSYAGAIAWGADSVDYGQLYQLLSPTPQDGDPEAGFLDVLELGAKRFRARVGDRDPREGKLLWWLGWARFDQADWAGAEEAFLGSLERAPEAANAWFYIALARQYRKDSEGALGALRSGWQIDPAAIVAAERSSGGSLRGLETLIGWCVENKRLLDAAFVSEMLAEANPVEPRHWSNLGLFLRDEGERIEIEAYKSGAPEPDPSRLNPIYERSFSAYSRALELVPDDPQLLNDTALMLHYHLERDLDRARSMYERAIALAEQKLAATDLSAEERERFETARTDATQNLEDLLDPEGAEQRAAERAAARKAAAEKAAAEKAAEDTGGSSGS